MAQRRNRRRQQRSTSNSPIAIAAAAIFLVLMVVAVSWIVLGMDTGAGDETDDPNSTPDPTSIGAVTETPTSEVTPVETGQAELTPDATATGEPEPGTTPTAEPEVTPTEVVTPESTPTVEPTPTPIVGDWGELPSAEMPTGSSVGRALQLSYNLDMSLQQIPSEATAYRLATREWSEESAAALVSSLGITGEVVAQGGGSFQASGNGEVYIAGNLIQYLAPASETDESELPDDASAVAVAREWLLTHQITGANTGNGEVVARNDDAGRILVRVKPLDPDWILAATPSGSITIGQGASILEANIRWPGAFEQSTYGLRAPDDLWADVSNASGYVELNAELLPEGSDPLVGQAIITSTDVAYTTAGSPETEQFLVPLIVFMGQATIEGADQPVPISIYVPAAGAEATPRG